MGLLSEFPSSCFLGGTGASTSTEDLILLVLVLIRTSGGWSSHFLQLAFSVILVVVILVSSFK